MSYAVAPAPGPKVRPGSVRTASILLYVSAVLLLIVAAVSFVPVGEMQKIVKEIYADDPQTQQAASVGQTIGIVVTGIIYVLIAVGLVVLGVFVGKGKQPARIITWVVSGLAVLCLGCGLAGSAVSNSLSGLGGADARSEELLKRIQEATPAWVHATSLTLQIVTLIAMIAVIILLALPGSNDYFRKEQQVWVPPTTPTTWPGDSTLPPPPPPAPGQ
jgi:xanthine/uracil permease